MNTLHPITVSPRLPDSELIALHLKCARGTITPEEEERLDLLTAMALERADNFSREAGCANNAPASYK